MKVLNHLSILVSFLLIAPCLSANPETESQTAWQVRALIVSPRTAEISGEITARILTIPTSIGTRISTGKPLVKFDCALYEAQLAEALADYSGAKSKLDAKESLRELKAAGKMEIEIARAEFKNAEAKVRSARVLVKRCEIPAPFDGVVVALHAKPHETLNSGEPLLEILDDSLLQIDLVVSSSWLRWLKTGTRFNMYIDEMDETVTARVSSINGRIDAVSKTVNLIAEIEDRPAGLIAGMSGTATFSPPNE